MCTGTDVVRPESEPPKLSQDGTAIGQFANISSFAEQMLVHEHALVKVREDVPLELPAIIGCGVTTVQGCAQNTATIIGMIPQGTKIELDGPSFLREKRIQGSSMVSNRFRVDMPRYIEFYLQGRLKLEEMVTKRINLDQVNNAFEDIKQVNVARSVITF